jgi:hypothetical protein
MGLDILQTQAYGYWRSEYIDDLGWGTTDGSQEVTS